MEEAQRVELNTKENKHRNEAPGELSQNTDKHSALSSDAPSTAQSPVRLITHYFPGKDGVHITSPYSSINNENMSNGGSEDNLERSSRERRNTTEIEEGRKNESKIDDYFAKVSFPQSPISTRQTHNNTSKRKSHNTIMSLSPIKRKCKEKETVNVFDIGKKRCKVENIEKKRCMNGLKGNSIAGNLRSNKAAGGIEMEETREDEAERDESRCTLIYIYIYI